MKSTYTFSLLQVSDATYREIEQKLRAAAYNDAFRDGVINMHGLALVTECGATWKGKELTIQCTELRGHTTLHKSGEWRWNDGETPTRVDF